MCTFRICTMLHKAKDSPEDSTAAEATMPANPGTGYGSAASTLATAGAPSQCLACFHSVRAGWPRGRALERVRQTRVAVEATQEVLLVGTALGAHDENRIPALGSGPAFQVGDRDQQRTPALPPQSLGGGEAAQGAEAKAVRRLDREGG